MTWVGLARVVGVGAENAGPGLIFHRKHFPHQPRGCRHSFLKLPGERHVGLMQVRPGPPTAELSVVYAGKPHGTLGGGVCLRFVMNSNSMLEC